MGNLTGYIVGGIQIIAGTILSFIPGGAAIGVPLIISGVTTIAGTALAPKPLGGRGGFEDSATYGFDQVTNAAFEGAPVPIVLGRCRLNPSYVSATTEQDGDEQKVNAVLLVSASGRYGCSDLRKVWLNDQPVESYDNVTVRWWPGGTYLSLGRTYPGGATGSPVGHTYVKTEKVGTPYEVGVEILKGDTYSYTTKVAVDELKFVMVWPGGLYQIDLDGKDAGEIEYTRWTADVEYQEGTADWVSTSSTTENSGWENGKNCWSIRDRRRSALRRIIHLKWTTTAIRTVRITSTVSDAQSDELEWVRDPTILRAEEIVRDKIDYSSFFVIELEAVATGSLSGGLPTVQVEIDGLRCAPLAGGVASFSRNPAVILHELLLDPVNGLGDIISASDLDDGVGGTWRTVEAACNVLWKNAYTSFRVDLVLDTQQSAPEWIQHILSLFRASLVEERGVLKLYQDIAASSVKTFDARQSRSASNRPVLMLEDGRADIQEHEIDSGQRATHVKVIYFDEAEAFRRSETPEFVDPDWTSSDPIVRKEFFLPGITHNVQAMREACYLRNRERLRTTMVEFGIGPGDFDLMPLDVVTVYADNPNLAGVTYQVLSVQHESSLVGRVLALKYDAAVYNDDYRAEQSLTKATYLSRNEALKKAKQVPKGISDLKITLLTS